MMNSPALDVKDFLDADSGLGLEFATNLFCFLQPDSPDQCATLYDTGGYAPEAQYRYDRPTIQIRVRGNKNGYNDAYALMDSIRVYLRGLFGVEINGTQYVGTWALTDIFFAGWDENKRPSFTINYRLHRTIT
jgi:hypothetical protein